MHSGPPEIDRRLDSWKAIAEYLQRDVSTVRRWEQMLGLPVRRVPGAKGHSVFAFSRELDAWLRTRDLPALAGDTSIEPAATPRDEDTTEGRGRPLRRVWRPAAVITLFVVALAAWRVRAPRAAVADVKLSISPIGVVASTASGNQLWRYDFPPGEKTLLPATGEQAIAVSHPDAVLIGTSYSVRLIDDSVRGGQLLRFALDGRRNQTFSFEDTLTFPTNGYAAPWVLTDFRAQPKSDTWRIAVAAHHYEWWPSLVTVLDSNWQRHGTFVHAGWIEMIRWLSRDRLVVSGTSHDRDAGAVALLDANDLDGQTPVERDGPLYCVSCGRGTPLRYLVFPRSEVNRASGSMFNRARLQLKGDRILVRTIETAESGIIGAADVLYELSSSLVPIAAAYSDRYWDLHRELESLGKLSHTKAECPDRDGPREILMWEPAAGWKSIAIPRQPR